MKSSLNSEEFAKQLENEFITSVTIMNGYLAIGVLTADILPTILDLEGGVPIVICIPAPEFPIVHRRIFYVGKPRPYKEKQPDYSYPGRGGLH